MNLNQQVNFIVGGQGRWITLIAATEWAEKPEKSDHFSPASLYAFIMRVLKGPSLTGEHVTDARPGQNPQNNEIDVTLKMDNFGTSG